ncbi:unnamed protein product [Lampetra planeri]
MDESEAPSQRKRAISLDGGTWSRGRAPTRGLVEELALRVIALELAQQRALHVLGMLGDRVRALRATHATQAPEPGALRSGESGCTPFEASLQPEDISSAPKEVAFHLKNDGGMPQEQGVFVQLKNNRGTPQDQDFTVQLENNAMQQEVTIQLENNAIEQEVTIQLENNSDAPQQQEVTAQLENTSGGPQEHEVIVQLKNNRGTPQDQDFTVHLENNAMQQEVTIQLENNAIEQEVTIQLENNAIEQEVTIQLENNAIEQEVTIQLENNSDAPQQQEVTAQLENTSRGPQEPALREESEEPLRALLTLLSGARGIYEQQGRHLDSLEWQADGMERALSLLGDALLGAIAAETGATWTEAMK